MKNLSLAFIGGGNMASALAAGLLDDAVPAANIHVIDPSADVRQQWQAKGCRTSAQADTSLSNAAVWLFCVKPQYLAQAAMQCRPYINKKTLVISVAAGISGHTLSRWLGNETDPYTRVVRCMPNTPALIGAGATGMWALSGVSAADKQLAEQLIRAVGVAIWVDSDAALDAVTALSGSGPAYVFLFAEAMIEGATALGLSVEQAKTLALATIQGAAQLADQSDEALAQLRQRVTSKGGTTAAALEVFETRQFKAIVQDAMQAANSRAKALATEFSS